MVEDVQDRETERERERDPDDATFEKKKKTMAETNTAVKLSARRKEGE